MIIEVMCRIADGPLRPGQLEITQAAVPLVSWSLNTPDGSQGWDQQGDDLAIELHLPDNTVWTGEAYPVSDTQLRGTGALHENSVPMHADVVVKRIDAMLAAL